jgi:type I restriction enzyme S subunit
MSEVVSIPQLRFPEFSGEWEDGKLGNYGNLINGLTYSPDNIVDEGLLVLRSSNVQNGQIYLNDNVYVNLDVDDAALTREDDILICVRNGSKRLIGKSTIINKNLPKSTHGAFMTVFRGESNKFISHWFHSSIYYKEVHKNLGATINSINGSDLKKFKTIFPLKPEQQKIAAFLTSVDTKIEQLSKKQELLGEYKKGLMQKIFSQAIRFKVDDGCEFPDWEEKKLEGMIDIVVDNRGKTPPVVKERNIPLIEVNAIGSKSIDYKKVSKFVTPETFKNWFRKYLNNGDILFSTVGQTAVCSIYFDSVKAAIAQNIVGLRFGSEDFKFMYYLLTERKNNHKFKRIEMGAVQPSVKVSQMIRIDFKIPSFPEQQKIANFLSSIDSKIEQVGKQLDESKQFKKALLQQMFV